MTGGLLDGRAGVGGTGVLEALNTRWHKAALIGFMAIVLAHWAEHVAQAIQIWVSLSRGWSVRSGCTTATPC